MTQIIIFSSKFTYMSHIHAWICRTYDRYKFHWEKFVAACSTIVYRLLCVLLLLQEVECHFPFSHILSRCYDTTMTSWISKDIVGREEIFCILDEHFHSCSVFSRCLNWQEGSEGFWELFWRAFSAYTF